MIETSVPAEMVENTSNLLNDIGRFFTDPISIGDTKLFFSVSDIILKLFIPLLALIAAYRVVIFLIKKGINRLDHTKEEIKINILKYSRWVFKAIALMAGSFILGNFLGQKIFTFFATFWKTLATPIIPAGDSKLSVFSITLTIPVFFLSSWLSKKSRGLLEASVLHKLSIQESTKIAIANLSRYGILFITLIVGLSVIGIDFSSIVVILGVLGIGVGFGLQGLIGNFFSGLIMSFEQPVKEGDRIIVNGVEGDVKKIRMLSTIITTLTNETIFIPNSQLMGNNIHNYSFDSPEIIITNNVEVAYTADLETAREILQKISKENPFAIHTKEAEVRILSFNSSGIAIELRTWIYFATKKYQAQSWTNMEIWRQFKENSISIPYPQLDLHVKESLPGNREE